MTLEGLHGDRREREARLRSMLDLCDQTPLAGPPVLVTSHAVNVRHEVM